MSNQLTSTQYDVRGTVAIVTLDNPPVNGLGHSLRSGIVAGLDKALADEKVKAIVLIGSDRAFSGGADVKEFGTAKAGYHGAGSGGKVRHVDRISEVWRVRGQAGRPVHPDE